MYVSAFLGAMTGTILGIIGGAFLLIFFAAKGDEEDE